MSKEYSWNSVEEGDYIIYTLCPFDKIYTGKFVGQIKEIKTREMDDFPYDKQKIIYITDLASIEGNESCHKIWKLTLTSSNIAKFVLLDISSNKDDFIEYLI